MVIIECIEIDNKKARYTDGHLHVDVHTNVENVYFKCITCGFWMSLQWFDMLYRGYFL